MTYEHPNPCALSFDAKQMLLSLNVLEQSLPLELGFVITDDRNPLESLQAAKAEDYRETLVSRLGADILAW